MWLTVCTAWTSRIAWLIAVDVEDGMMALP